MKNKKKICCSNPNILELAQHLRQEYLFVQSEKAQIQKLNAKILRTSEKLYHLNWTLRQQRIIVDQASLSIIGANDSNASDVSSCCFTSAALDSTSFIDSYKRLGSKDALYSALLTALRNDPSLVAKCLVSDIASTAVGRNNLVSSSLPVVGDGDIIAIIVSSVYGDALVPEDRVLLMHLITELIALQVSPSEQPRRLLRHGSCVFSRVLRMFQESLSSAKLFLISALREAVIAVLAEDDLYLDTDAERAVIRFPPEERNRHFGKEGTPEYSEKISKYKDFATDKLRSLVARFVSGIQTSVFCFPEHLRWVIRELYAVLTAENRFSEGEVGALCTDLIFGHFICHAVMNPELYGIVDMHVTTIARFNLMQIAQVIQILAMSKFEKGSDSRFYDVIKSFMEQDGSKSNLSNIIDILIESGTNESLSPQDNISRCLKDVTRTCILMSEQQLYALTNFLHDVSSSEKISDETRSSLQQLLNGIPRHNKVTNESCPPPANETNTKKGGLLDKVRNKTKDTLKDDKSTGSTEHLISCPEILVIPIGGDGNNVLPGMLPEEKVLEIAIQKRQVKVRMNLGDGELESVASGSVLSEKRTRFSQDQESIGTSDNLEAISEAASTHSVESSLDTEDEDADCCVDVNEGDNLSDMVSANVSSGRGTPNVSGRDTPSESSEAGAGEDDDGHDGQGPGAGGGAIGGAIGGGQRVVVHVNQPDEDNQPGSEHIANVAGGDGKIVQKPLTLRTACRPAPAPPLNAIPIVHPRRPNTQNDIEEKFGKFDCKPSSTIMSTLSADETKSLLSDTWSTDVLASDTEGVEQAGHGDSSHGLMIAPGGPGHGMFHAINQSLEISETASQSDAWSTDVLMSDTERLQEFMDMDDSSAAGEAVGSDVVDGPGGDPGDIPQPQPQPDSQSQVKLRSHKSTPRNSSGDSSTAEDPTSGRVEQETALDSLTTSMTQTLGRISFDLRQKNLFSLKDDDDLTMTEVEGLVMSLNHPQTTSTPTKSGEGRRGHRASICELLTSLDSSTGNASSSGGTAVAGDINNSVCDEQSFSLIDFEKEIAEVDGVPFPVRSNTLTAENASSNLIDFLSEEVDDQVKTNGQATAVEDKSNRASTGAIPKNPLRLRGSKNADRSVSLDSEPRRGNSSGGFFKLPNIKNKFQEKMKSFKDKRTSMSSIIPSVSTRSPGISNVSSVENNSSAINPSNETTDDILEKYRRKRSEGEGNEIQSSPLDAAVGGGATDGKSIAAFKPSSSTPTPGDISPSGITSSTDSVFGTAGITKRKLRRVLSSVDIHGLPITCIQSVSSSGADAHSELVMFLRLLLSEAKHLNNSQQVVALQEAIRVVESLDEKSCQQLFWSLREDYQRRAPYISYLISSRQTLLSTEAHFDSLYDHLMQEKLTCLHNLVTVCVKQFLEKKDKAVAHFVRYFQIPGTADEKVQLVEKFLEYLFQSMDTDPVWQMASEDMVDHAKEIIERVIMSQVYMFALYPNGDGDVLRDQILQQHIARLSRTVTPAHPDLKIPKIYHGEAPWPAAQEEIWAINAFKTPKEKVLCVVRTCSIIMSLLSLASDRSVPAADDLVPVLVFVVIKANPPSLLSTIQYVNSFYEGHFEGEEAYWWTQFSSVVEFIKTMDYQ